MRYIVTNFAQGNGPYLRSAGLALAINARLEALGHSRLGVIVPWVYADKQRRIMLEEFNDYEQKHPGEILLDRTLGDMLRSVIYDGGSYESALYSWVERYEATSHQAHRHLSGILELEDLKGHKHSVRGQDIVLEVSRIPRLNYGVAPSYSTNFAHPSEILEASLLAPQGAIVLDRALIRRGIPLARHLEERHVLQCLTQPSTFSYQDDRKPFYANEVDVPLMAWPMPPCRDKVERAIYVTVSGISDLAHLYTPVLRWGMKIYANDRTYLPDAVVASPDYLASPNILFHFARSGWGAAWSSILLGKPLVLPPFDPYDDPEIYFNNRCLTTLGFGIVDQGQSLDVVLSENQRLSGNIELYKKRLTQQFGTINGLDYAANVILSKYLGVS